MNVLILNWRDIKNPKSGGAEILTMEHAKTWTKAGHKVFWFTSLFPGGKKNETIDSVRIIRRGNYFSVYLLAPFFYLFSGIKFDLVIDEIHGLPFFTPIYVRKPKIVLIHEVAGKIWDYMFPFPVNVIGKVMESFYFTLYSGIKFWIPSRSTEDELMRHGINKKDIVLVPCGINNALIEKLPLKEKIPTFIFVSRVVKMKGIEEVIKAFFGILEEIRDGQLWIVGDGDERYLKKLLKMMEDYSISKKVKFFGRVTDRKKLELMRRAHLLLHASVKEGWGIVVIEAASQGTPSVVYDVDGLRDSVINGKTGIVLSKNTSIEMSRQAVSLIGNKKRYGFLQEEGLKWAKSLNWAEATKKSLRLIEEVVSEKK